MAELVWWTTKGRVSVLTDGTSQVLDVQRLTLAITLSWQLEYLLLVVFLLYPC